LHQLGPIAPRQVVLPPGSSAPTVVPATTQQQPAPRLTRQVTTRPSRRAAFAGAGVAAGVLAVALLLIRTRHEHDGAAREAARAHAARPVAAAVAPRAPASTAPAGRPRDLPTPNVPALSAAGPERVRLSLAGPFGAEALLDGKLIGTLPIDVELPRAPGVRRLTVRSTGTRPWTRVVAADIDVALKVTLTRLHAEAQRPRKSPSSPPSNAPSSVIKDPFQ
jgi:hypothetical protein